MSAGLVEELTRRAKDLSPDGNDEVFVVALAPSRRKRSYWRSRVKKE